MKKFLALLFVSAALTSMAAVPHVNNTAAVKGKAPKTTKIAESKMVNPLSAPVMKASSNALTPHKLFTDKGVTPAENRLLKKAPRRVTGDDVMSTKIAFMLAYDYASDTSAEPTLTKDYLAGGWEVEMAQQGDNTFNAYLYFTGIPFQINVDYAAKTAEMTMGQLGGWQYADTTYTNPNNYVIHDTTEYLFIVDEAYMTDENAQDFTNLTGTLYEDGTVYFENGWCIFDLFYVKTTRVRNGQSNVSYDTIPQRSEFYRSTYLMTANANHEYVSQANGATRQVPAYMFQYDDTTVIAWNLWGMGNRGIEFYLHDNGEMAFPSDQLIHTEDVSDYESMYPNYDWSIGNEFFNVSYDLDVEADTAIDATLSENDKIGTFDANGVYWDASGVYDVFGYNGNWYFGLGFYPFLHNKLTFTDGTKLLYGAAETPTIEVAEGDDAYTFTGVTSQEGCVVYLMTYDYDGNEVTNVVEVDNPYIVPRTEVDQTIYLAAISDGSAIGLNLSAPYMSGYVVPAKVASAMRGDLNADGNVNTSDISILITALLNSDMTIIDMDADPNLDGQINTGDLSALINYLLNGTW